jgi:hypothetical protein
MVFQEQLTPVPQITDKPSPKSTAAMVTCDHIPASYQRHNRVRYFMDRSGQGAAVGRLGVHCPYDAF